MKVGWEIKSLDDVCYKASSNVSQNQLNDEVGIYPIFGASGKIKDISFFHHDKPYLSIVKDGSGVGRVTKMDAFTSVIGTLQYILPKEDIDLDYLYYSLISIDFKKYVAGAAIPHIYFKDYKNEPFLWTPLKEQQRIVAVLDEAFEQIATARANTEKNLQNARALFESQLQSVFIQRGEGWIEKVLKEVCEKITDGTHQTPKYFDEGVIFLSSRNVTSGKVDWDKIKYIDAKQHTEMQRRVSPKLHDILLAKNGTTGVAAMVDRDVPFDIYVSLALLRALPVIIPKLLLYFVNSPVAKQQFNKRLKGVGVPNLHLEEIREVKICFPQSLKKQESIIAELDNLLNETQRLESLYQRKLNALDALKKSLLHKAFAGEL